MAEMKFWDKDPKDTEITLITPAITNFLISEVGKSRFDLKFFLPTPTDLFGIIHTKLLSNQTDNWIVIKPK